MRKNAGFMLMTLLLLIVPALANAWTLTVKVAGGNSTNSVAVVYPTSSIGAATTTTATKTIKSGTVYLYPTKAGVTVAATGNNVATTTLDGSSLDVASRLLALNSGKHTLQVVYAADTTAQLLLNQAASGGQIYAQNRNNTWTTDKVTGLPLNTEVPLTIAADANHKVLGYSLVSGTTITTGMPAIAGTPGEVVSFSLVAAGQTVTPVFGIYGKVSATLFAPNSGVAGTPITLAIVATTNSDPASLAYSVSINGAAYVAAPGGSYTIGNPVEGTYTVRAKVVSADNGLVITDAATIVVANAQTAAIIQCTSCHNTQSPTIVANYKASVHNLNTHSSCAACHTENTPHSAGINALNIDKATFKVISSAVPGPYGRTAAKNAVFCTVCHTGSYAAPHVLTDNFVNCNSCHTANGAGDAHSIAKPTCVGCHAVARNSGAGFVQDNNGVRAITAEFTKWSHHVTGVTLQDAHCAACHLEGKVVDGEVVVDKTKHMVDAKTHLRNADTDADFAWDPANPDHTLMDNFCMSCHDANGATSAGSIAIQGVIVPAAGKTASAANPFGDTISNRYDKMQRPAVVDAKGQFNLSNPSHHAVMGQKYTGRTRTAGDPRVVKQLSAAFSANSSATLPGKRSTIYDSRVVKTDLPAQNYNVSKFVETYETLSPAPGTSDKTLGDDSVLHCGDCHTVGQFRLADVGVMPKNAAVIGAHGSNNEYLLRNSIGTDERHVGQTYSSASGINTFTNLGSPLLVCFNCHSYQAYGSIGNATGANGTNHAGEYANSNRCNGPVNTISFAGYTTSINAEHEPYAFRLGLGQRDYEGWAGNNDKNLPYSGVTSDTDFSNLFGMQCANCHNSGPNNAFGGIHGSKVQVYTDANGAQQKAYRFLPGLGNTMFVPGSAAGVGTVSDLNWEVKSIGTKYNALKVAGQTPAEAIAAGAAVVDNGGCYTLVPETGPGGTNADYALSPAFEQKVDQPAPGTHIFGTWGGCDDHRGNAHGKAFSANGVPAGDYTGGTVPTGGAGVIRKVLRPVTY